MKTLLDRFRRHSVDDNADMSDIKIDDQLLARSKRLFENESFVEFYQLNSTTVVKIGEPVRMVEADNMRFIRDNSTCPVPNVHQAYIDEAGRGIIVMDLMQGQTLENVWDSLKPPTKNVVISQLKDILASIHDIRGEYIGSLSNGPCLDPLFDGLESRGPFPNTEQFHSAIKAACRDRDGTGFGEVVGTFVDQMQEKEIVFCHADFQPRNILVDSNFKVTAILDWEYAGYYPRYWEYTKALYRPDWESAWIRDKANEAIMRPRPSELAAMLHVRSIIW